MRINIILTTILLVVLVGCEKENQNAFDSDEMYLELAYSQDYLYPEGFYFEKDLNGSVYYENTVSIKPENERENIWLELNTSQKSQAKMWSDLSNDYSSVNRLISGENETEKYFEFKRVNVENDNDVILSRVHKTSYFISLHDRFKELDTIGTYKSESNSESIKELIEYLWSCGTLGIYDKVIKSEIEGTETEFEHFIQSLSISYGDWGLYDMISIYDYRFRINKTEGLINVKIQKIKEIQGKFNEGL